MKRDTRNLFPLILLALSVSLSALASGPSKNLKSTPQGKAYRAQEEAIRAGDFEGYKKTMTKASAAEIDRQMKEMGMDAKGGMEVLKAMLPTDLKLTALKVEKSKATLEATGKVGGEMNRGTVDFELEDGQWKIVKQSWTNAK
jgi:hypothetical protein